MSYIMRLRGSSALAAGCLLLAACTGGKTSKTDTASSTPTTTTDTTSTAQADKENDAARLAHQATFGATPAVIDRIVSLGVSGWLDEQFAASGSSYADLAAKSVNTDVCGFNAPCRVANFTRYPVAMRFYANALSQPDQLRQRVALALGQIVVAGISEGTPSASGVATYNQIFLDNAFGNYRDVLKKTMMSCLMGRFLDMNLSPSWSPNENYARELLQLFSMGPNKLNMDGSLITDSTGAATANYTLTDIQNVARALTGWGCQSLTGDGINDRSNPDYYHPMKSFVSLNQWIYDTGTKKFLGVTVGNDQNGNVEAVLDAAMNNSSTPPFIVKRLIQNLVTSNPTPAYVARVAAVFVNNGSNVRGDLKAVVRAILTDSEARGTGHTTDRDGKVKEPILLLTGIARASGMTSDGWVLTQHDGEMGQPVFQSPSVFNFYPPDFPLPKSATLLSPASKLIGTGSVVLRHNLIYNWTVGAATTPAEFAATTQIAGTNTGTAQDWSSWEAFGTNIDGMIDRVDLLLTARSMNATQKAALKSAATAITNSNSALQARLRAQAMLYVVATSPLFQVDR